MILEGNDKKKKKKKKKEKETNKKREFLEVDRKSQIVPARRKKKKKQRRRTTLGPTLDIIYLTYFKRHVTDVLVHIYPSGSHDLPSLSVFSFSRCLFWYVIARMGLAKKTVAQKQSAYLELR